MRRRISVEERIKASEQAKQFLISHPLFISSQSIACYLAQQNEFDCGAIIEEVWRLGKQCYLPVLSLQQEKTLEFVEYRADTLLRLNHYQILEPGEGEVIATTELDLVIVPLVGFDERGHRVGMGAGYYDRTFAFKREGEKPWLLGLGYELQKVAAVPNYPWDVLLDGVLTEEKMHIKKN